MKPLRLAGLALFLLAIACSDATGPERPQIRDFETAHQRWQAQNLHTYAFTLQRSCFCANVHPLYVLVLNDGVAGVFDLETGTFVDSNLGETIEDLFSFVHNAIDGHARLIRTEYDAARGFPTAIDYDGAAQIADDEIFYHISDVHPVTPQVPG
jgi:hypothetical protein